MQQQHDENTKARHAVIWIWNYIWGTYLLKQLYLAWFKQVEAKTKCDTGRLTAALSFTWTKGLWKFYIIILTEFSPDICFLSLYIQ